MRVEILGRVRVLRGDDEIEVSGDGQRALLGLLALAAGKPVSRAQLVDGLWGQRPPPTASNVIQTHVARLRRLLEPERPPRMRSKVLASVGDGYALELAAVDVDLVRFRELVSEAGAAQRLGEPRRAAELLAGALALRRGAPLDDLPFLATHPAVISVAEEVRAAVVPYGGLMLALGGAAEALPLLAEAAAGQQLDEAVHGLLIRAYQAVGRIGDAFAAYEQARRRLVDDLGVDPGPDLAGAHTALVHHGTGGQAGHGPGPAATLPVPAAQPAPAQFRPAQFPPAQLAADRAGWAEPAGAPPPEPAPPAAGRPVPAQLPANVAGFTGRAAELAELSRLFAAVDAPDPEATDPAGTTAVVISAVSGTAGVGKTALAVRWAHQVRDRFPGGQLYVNLRGYDPEQPLAPADALARFLAALGVPDDDLPLGLDERAARYRAEIRDRRLLVVLDNASSAEQVRPLLPGSPTSAAVLVTSRDSLAGLAGTPGVQRIDLDLLPAADAVALLRRLIGARVDAEPRAAATLAARCARLPLALRVAAELAVSRPNAPLADLVAELADQQHRLDLLDAGGDQRAAVRAVFSWSYRHLPEPAARTFRLVGLHPGVEFELPAAAALACTGLAAARAAVDLLAAAGLLQLADGGRFGMHDLLRAYAAGLAAAEDTAEQRRAALTRLFDYYLAAAAAAMDALHPAETHRRPRVPAPSTPLPDLADPDGARGWLDRELSTIVSVAGYTATYGWPGHTVRLAATLYRYLAGGHHTDAITIHGHARHAARQTGDASGEADALTGLGAAYLQRGQYQPAADQYEQAQARYRQAGDRLGEARVLGNLGIVHDRLGRHETAIEHHRRALALYARTGDRVGEARTLCNLGSVELRVGRYEQAAEHYLRALELSRQAGDRADEAHALSGLGNIDMQLGRPADAVGRHRKALALHQQLGDQHGIAHELDNLGAVHTRLGQAEQAAHYHRQALTLFRQAGDRDGEGWALNGLGEAARAARDHADARAHHLAALTVSADTGNRDQLARAHAGLGHAYEALDEPGPARQHFDAALDLYTELDHPDGDRIRTRVTRR